MIVLRELARAKINLYLHVTGKRADGYHLLDSWMGFAGLGDKLEVLPGESLSFTCTGPYAAQVPEKDNSVLAAAAALQNLCGITKGAQITLHKNLPVGAGIGGGSADAAAALRLLMRFWQVRPASAELDTLAMKLGADVPACLRSDSLYASGIGEVIEPAPALTALFAVLVNPGKPLLTKEVFARHKAAYSPPLTHHHAFGSPQERLDFLRHAHNDLQETAVSLMPQIGEILAALAGQRDCLFSRMSGSGATCFGLYHSLTSAQNAAARLGAEHTDWWVQATTLQ